MCEPLISVRVATTVPVRDAEEGSKGHGQGPAAECQRGPAAPRWLSCCSLPHCWAAVAVGARLHPVLVKEVT